MKVIHDARFTINEEIYHQEDNVFVFDKPYKCTSFDLVAKVKYAMKRKFGKKLSTAWQVFMGMVEWCCTVWL